MIGTAERRLAGSGGIVLPADPRPRARRQIDRSALDEAVEAGRSLGFVSRDPVGPDPAPIRRRPGPHRREPQDRLSVPGPRRVTDAFRAFCTQYGLTHWQGLDRLMRPATGGAAGAPADRPDFRADVASLPGTASDDPVAPAAATIAMPAAMAAWIEARGRCARYLDAADYVRDLIRRDQQADAAILALEAALEAGVEKTPQSGSFDIAAFLRRRRPER